MDLLANIDIPDQNSNIDIIAIENSGQIDILRTIRSSINTSTNNQQIRGQSAISLIILNNNFRIMHSIYLDGNNEDTGNGIAVDKSGNIMIIGSTNSRDFPEKNSSISSNNKFGKQESGFIFVIAVIIVFSGAVITIFYVRNGNTKFSKKKLRTKIRMKRTVRVKTTTSNHLSIETLAKLEEILEESKSREK